MSKALMAYSKSSTTASELSKLAFRSGSSNALWQLDDFGDPLRFIIGQQRASDLLSHRRVCY
jgi:hypothetical protein